MNERHAGSDGSSYYSILGIHRDASFSEIRTAYRKLALKWHPDRWTKNPKVAGEANRRFQSIQEAYSVLSHKGKRSMYDAGLYNPFEEEEEEDEGFADFMQEMLSLMDKVTPQGQQDSFEELQKMFLELTGGDNVFFDVGQDRRASKRTRVASFQESDADRRSSCTVGDTVSVKEIRCVNQSRFC